MLLKKKKSRPELIDEFEDEDEDAKKIDFDEEDDEEIDFRWQRRRRRNLIIWQRRILIYLIYLIL